MLPFLLGVFGYVVAQPFLDGATQSKSIADNYLIKNWDVEEGLVGFSVTSMVEDPFGYLWLGSFSGISRFDGVDFFNQTSASNEALKGEMVLAQLVDSNGALWLGMQGAVVRMEGGLWRRFDQSDGVPDKNIRGFTRGSDGIIYVAANEELLRWNGLGFEQVQTPRMGEDDGLWWILTDEDGVFWLGRQGELYRRVDEEWQAVAVPSLDEHELPLRGICAARGGGVWVADINSIRHWRDGEWVRVVERPEGFQGDAVKLLEDRRGNLWVAAYNNGLLRVDPMGESLRLTTAEGLSNNSCMSLHEDTGGNIWVGTNGGGVNRLRRRLVHVFDETHGVAQGVINCLAPRSEGGMWVGTHGSGLVALEDGRFGEPVETEDGGMNLTSWVISNAMSADGDLYVGLVLEGVYRQKNGVWEPFKKEYFKSQTVTALHFDRQGTLWIASEKGLVRWREGSDPSLTAPLEAMNGSQARSIEETPDGILWLCLEDGSVFRVIPSHSDPFTPLDFPPVIEAVDMEMFPGFSKTVALCAAQDGQLWAVGGEGELARLRSEGWERFDTRQGLPKITATGIQDDGEGNLWLATVEGILRIDRASLEKVSAMGREEIQCRLLDKSDGMRSHRCRVLMDGNMLLDDDDYLWVATMKGVVRVDPRDHERDVRSHRVHFEQMVLDRETVISLEGLQGQVQVPAGTRRVMLHYTAPNLGMPERLRYQVRLLGVDQEWIPVGDQKVAQLLDLKPGLHEYQVRVTDRDGVVRDPHTSILFKVEAYFWELPWVQGGIAVVILLGVARAVWKVQDLRLQRARQQHEIERQLEGERIRAQWLLIQKEASDVANQAKSDFLATVSHEIRTPLNGVIGFSELLRNSPLDGIQREFADSIRNSAELLLTLTNDVLDYSKIESGKLSLVREPFDLRGVVQDVLGILSTQATAKGLELAWESPIDIVPVVEADPVRTRQILLNLVGNALKFTSTGEVIVSIQPSEKSAYWACHVRDTGPGISELEAQSLFHDPNPKSGDAHPTLAGGGLGLSICKRLVELMGGEIGVQGKELPGATFWFLLPASQKPVPQKSSPTPSGKVLLLSTASSHCKQLILHFRLSKIPYVIAASGGEALEYLRRSVSQTDETHSSSTLPRSSMSSADPETVQVDNNQRIAWVLFDEILPDLDTVRFFRTIRAQPNFDDVAMILIQGQQPDMGHRDEFSHQCDALISRPILRTSALLSVMRTAESVRKLALNKPQGFRSPNPVATTTELPPVMTRARVLLVEDNHVNLRVAQVMLQQLACEVHLAANGREAVRKSREQVYDIILMDCYMPDMDGFEATRLIRADEVGQRYTPILAVTADSAQVAREKCVAAGMDDFIAKPFHKSDLARALDRWVFFRSQ